MTKYYVTDKARELIKLVELLELLSITSRPQRTALNSLQLDYFELDDLGLGTGEEDYLLELDLIKEAPPEVLDHLKEYQT